MNEQMKILIAYDGSDCADAAPSAQLRIVGGVDNLANSDAAVDAVCRRRWPKGTEVRIVAVVDTVMAITPDPSQPDVKWIEVGDENNWEQVRNYFAPFAEKLRDAGLEAAIIVKGGSPADQLLEEAEAWAADCFFVGAKGTRGMERLLLGSVSSAVAARAPCSVEVVRLR